MRKPENELQTRGKGDLHVAVKTAGLTKLYRHQRGLSDIIAGRTLPTITALTDVTLSVNEGEVFGLVGPNGSGKTTFLKLLSTILSPTSGAANIFGHDIHRDGRAIRALVSLVTGEERSLYWRLTGRQNLEFFARVYALNGTQIKHKISELLEIFDLSDVDGVRVGEYSTGMKQRLAIARGLINGPKLLFLDEPTRGLDPIAAYNLLKGVKERAVDYFANTVILTTHIMREVEQLCENIAVLNRGAVAYAGSVDGLRKSLERYERYSLILQALSEQSFDTLRSRNGVKSCTRARNQDGLTEIELEFSTNTLGLSEVLRTLLSENVEILRCTKKEQSLEEMFRAIFDRSGVGPEEDGR